MEQLITLLADKLSVDEESIENILAKPKDASHGDIALPCFPFAKNLGKPPAQIASELEVAVNAAQLEGITAKATGPFLNFIIDNSSELHELINTLQSPITIEKTDSPKVILVESPGPNTNKPLHLGHLRNMLLGDVAYTLKSAIGHDVHIVNVLNDRGIHICKSMLAYQKWGNNETPESTNTKPDHFVGKYYVRYAQEAAKSEESKTQLEQEANEMLEKWEQEDLQVRQLWKTMNDWAIKGFHETYNSLDFKMEKEYAESDTYLGGKEIVQTYLEKGVFEKNEKGAIIVNLESKGLDKKVLLRANGTAIYITQDINMAKLRYDDYKFDEMIYVVGNEQEYHFKVLFEIFKLLDWPFGGNCQHFSYGMIELPTGKMKSREGNVIDTDDLLKQMKELSYDAVKERYKDLDETEMKQRAEVIGTGAVRFFFLKNDPLKNFVFDPKSSLSFEGETGPYVMYTHARICSILRKAQSNNPDLSQLTLEEEKQLMKTLAEFQDIVQLAADLKPHKLAHYLLKLAQQFNKYYGNNKIIDDNQDVQNARLALSNAIKNTLHKGLELLGIQAPERM